MHSLLRLVFIGLYASLVYILVILALKFPILWPVYGYVVFRLVRKTATHSAHGTARWATGREVKAVASDTGLVLGYVRRDTPLTDAIGGLLLAPAEEAVKCGFDLNRTRQFDLVKIRPVHAAIFIPSGGGKGQGFIIPTLANDPRSAVVIDPKGEACRATAQWRRDMGHRVVVLDPFGLCGGTDALNPLDFVSRDPSLALDEINAIATALVEVRPNEQNPHFPEAARLFLANFTAGVIAAMDEEHHHLGTVRKVISSEKLRAAAIEDMSHSPAFGGFLPQLAGQLAEFKDRELASVLSTVHRTTRFADTPAVHAVLSRSTFRPTDLLDGPVTVFVVIPPQYLASLAPLLRLWIGCLMRGLMGRGVQRHREVVFHVDEAASLGQMEEIDTALSVGRGYGLRLLLYYQSAAQLRACFPDGKDQNVLANTTQVYAGVTDYQTADTVSNMLGSWTQVVASGGTNWGHSSTSGSNQQSTTRSYGGSDNWQFQGRKLLDPSEVMRLHVRTAIVFAPGVRPFTTHTVRAYEGDLAGRTATRGRVVVLATVLLCMLFWCVVLTLYLEKLTWANLRG